MEGISGNHASIQHASATLYRPGVVAAYTVLSMPVGLALYGLNLYRRGSRCMGATLTAFAGILYVGVLIDGIVSPTRRYSFLDLGLLPIPLAFGVYRIEAGPCRKAFAHGAKPALWWHPFLVIASTMLVAWFLWIVVLKLTNV